MEPDTGGRQFWEDIETGEFSLTHKLARNQCRPYLEHKLIQMMHEDLHLLATHTHPNLHHSTYYDTPF